MTTKVTVQCPKDSHWDIKVSTQDKMNDPRARLSADLWVNLTTVVVLKPTESYEAYVHSTRRIVIEEVEIASQA
jgi:hypothetical protein